MRRNHTGGAPFSRAGCQQRRVADLDPPVARTGCFQSQSQAFGVGRLAVGATEIFEPGLQEFRRLPRPLAKYRAVAAEGGGRASLRRGEIGQGGGNGEFGPEAESPPAPIGGQQEATADVFARKIEEDRSRLQNRGSRDA